MASTASYGIFVIIGAAALVNVNPHHRTWVNVLAGVIFYAALATGVLGFVAYITRMAFREGGLSRSRPWTRNIP